MNLLANAGMVSLVALMLGLLGLGIESGARRRGLDPAAARRLRLVVSAGVALWLAATAAIAASGALAAWNAVPPRWPFLPLTAFVTAVLLSRTATARALIAHTPRHWLVAAQTFRVGVELVLFALYLGGRAPVQVTFEGRNFDILVGLTAPVVAWCIARKRLPPALVALWNLLGLAVLANTVGTVATSTPGPLHHAWPGAPFTAIATWPTVWLPAFLAPLAVFLHLVSLRQGGAKEG